MLDWLYVQSGVKTLSIQTKKRSGKIISSTHVVFVSDREILDGVLVTNELNDLVIRDKRECMFLKVGFSQAYDCVNWDFLIFMSRKTGFEPKWLEWMEGGVFSSNMSVIINRGPLKDFKVTRGLRKCDPLSPFLFALMVEGLAGIVRKVGDLGEYKGFKINNHLSYGLL